MPGIIELPFEAASSRKFDLIERKVDGSRHTWLNGQLCSDRGINRALDRYPHIAKELATLNIHCRGEVALPMGNVLQLNNSKNWHAAKYFIFDLYSFNGMDFTKHGTLAQRAALELIISKLSHLKHIMLPEKFGGFGEGWDFITSKGLEGLVLKNDNGGVWKIKHMKEEKLPIVGYIPGSTKGAFLVDRAGVQCKVSATSVGYVNACKALIDRGLKPYVEIEYLFVTDDGHPFQPRLRRLGTLEDLTT